jgi:hypothetical protein
MPSDPRFAETLRALQAASSPFQTAIVGAVDELRAFLAAQRAPRAQRASSEAVKLGEFAAGRIDAAKFAELVGVATTLDSIRLGRLEQAYEVLDEFVRRGDELFRLDVQPGGDLRDAVRTTLAARGRVFNAAHEFDLLSCGGALREPVGEALDFRNWSKPQRTLAPPLIVEVNGADVQADGLAEYLDGTQKIVLLVNGPVAPAPLARLIGPATFVMQTSDVAQLTLLAEFNGPGIAAVLPEGCARFVHDPRRGAQLGQRLHIDLIPETPAKAVAGGSLRAQQQDLAWLAELARLATSSAPLTVEVEPAAPAAPADQLAAWLLSQLPAGEEQA